MREPTIERAQELTLIAFELALRRESANGHAPAEDVQWLLARLSLAAPRYAANLPRVMGAIGAEVAAAVRRLAAAPVTPGVTSFAPGPPDLSRSGVAELIESGEAARMLGIGAAGVRAAIRRGRLAAAKGEGGRWRIRREAVSEYGRQHGRADGDAAGR